MKLTWVHGTQWGSNIWTASVGSFRMEVVTTPTLKWRALVYVGGACVRTSAISHPTAVEAQQDAEKMLGELISPFVKDELESCVTIARTLAQKSYREIREFEMSTGTAASEEMTARGAAYSDVCDALERRKDSST